MEWSGQWQLTLMVGKSRPAARVRLCRSLRRLVAKVCRFCVFPIFHERKVGTEIAGSKHKIRAAARSDQAAFGTRLRLRPGRIPVPSRCRGRKNFRGAKPNHCA